MKRLFFLILFFFLYSIIISGCSSIPNTSLSTPWPTDYLSTAIALTMGPIPNTPPTSSSIESPTTETPNNSEETPIIETEVKNTQQSSTPSANFRKTPSKTPTPTIPEAAIQIVSPGSLSRVISPIKMEAYAQPGAENKIFIDLIGENGQVFAREVRIYQNLTRLWAPVNLEISFKLETVAEYARLQIHTEDQFHRTIALYPVHLILQSSGINKIYSNTILSNRCVLREPVPDEKISGGEFVIDGEFMPFNKQPIQIDLITETGQLLNSKTIPMQSVTNDAIIHFIVDMDYKVQTTTPVRLTIRQIDEQIPGDVFVCSQLLKLAP